ncbi:hypothetical protein M9194_01750 [Vibrio sp. S4M6]|uniref:hypothetical protein n=1 Tax=Vibrio sinus TaxID=2946865 RepID=UPI00202AC219|nr:hypothetical protein [Vibrio sinus]MCL9780153.1 hypothetical protein [Vibrio sinus]
MDIRAVSKGLVIGLSALILQGCFQKQIERVLDSDTYGFNGIYQSDEEEASFIRFEHGVMRYVTPHMQVVKNFKVEDGQVRIILRNSSMEKRDDLVMSIHGTGEYLTCTTCAKYKMGNRWKRAAPQS